MAKQSEAEPTVLQTQRESAALRPAYRTTRRDKKRGPRALLQTQKSTAAPSTVRREAMPAAACQQKDAGQDSNHGRNATNHANVTEKPITF